MSTASIVPSELVKAALELPEKARAEFASVLLESLAENRDDPEVIREEWKTEIARRIEEIRDGKVQLVDGHATLIRHQQALKARLGK